MLHGKSHFWQSWDKGDRPVREGKGRDFMPCQRQQSRVFKSNINTFKIVDKWAKSNGATIYNCSNVSQLGTFPTISLDEALGFPDVPDIPIGSSSSSSSSSSSRA